MNTDTDNLHRFMQGMAAAAELHARAGRQGCFVESVCLCATVIDAALRMGIILKHQLITRSPDLLPELLYQGKTDNPVSEREIYRRALKNDVINQGIYDELNDLYDARNRVVHRYIISEITTKEVLDIAIRYDNIKDRVSEAVGILEGEQLREKVGMTVRGDTGFELQELLSFSEKKHGDDDLSEKLRK